MLVFEHFFDETMLFSLNFSVVFNGFPTEYFLTEMNTYVAEIGEIVRSHRRDEEYIEEISERLSKVWGKSKMRASEHVALERIFSSNFALLSSELA